MHVREGDMENILWDWGCSLQHSVCTSPTECKCAMTNRCTGTTHTQPDKTQIQLDFWFCRLIILNQLPSNRWRVGSSVLTFWVTSSCRVLILIPSSSQLGAAKYTTPFSLSITVNWTRQLPAPQWFKTSVWIAWWWNVSDEGTLRNDDAKHNQQAIQIYPQNSLRGMCYLCSVPDIKCPSICSTAATWFQW